MVFSYFAAVHGPGTSSTQIPKMHEIYHKFPPMSTMNDGEALPSFFDANQDSPDHHNHSTTNTPGVVNAEETPVTEDTPIGQRCLFPIEHNDDTNNNAYLRRLHNQSVELDIALVREEEEEEGDDSSNCCANEVEELNTSLRSAYMDRVEVLFHEGIEEIVSDSKINCCLFVNELGARVSLAKPPDNWVPKEPKVEAGEPEFDEVDNPGSWNQFTFKPKFSVRKAGQVPKGQYMHHALPMGARPVPQDEEGERRKAGWDFH